MGWVGYLYLFHPKCLWLNLPVSDGKTVPPSIEFHPQKRKIFQYYSCYIKLYWLNTIQFKRWSFLFFTRVQLSCSSSYPSSHSYLSDRIRILGSFKLFFLSLSYSFSLFVVLAVIPFYLSDNHFLKVLLARLSRSWLLDATYRWSLSHDFFFLFFLFGKKAVSCVIVEISKNNIFLSDTQHTYHIRTRTYNDNYYDIESLATTH